VIAPTGDAPHLDPGQWSRLIERLETPVILVVISSWMGGRLRRDCTAEDIWQETLAMAWRDRRSHGWVDLRTFRAWLLGIAKNRIHDAIDRMNALKRNRGRLPESLHADDNRSASELLPPQTTTPSRIASDLERARIIEEALQALPAPYAEAVRLRLFEELPMREVAARLGVGLTTANERFFRGAALYQLELQRRLGSTHGVRR
jgi:RNA polymerase sigma-70 factor (ECF subfamily)